MLNHKAINDSRNWILNGLAAGQAEGNHPPLDQLVLAGQYATFFAFMADRMADSPVPFEREIQAQFAEDVIVPFGCWFAQTANGAPSPNEALQRAQSMTRAHLQQSTAYAAYVRHVDMLLSLAARRYPGGLLCDQSACGAAWRPAA